METDKKGRGFSTPMMWTDAPVLRPELFVCGPKEFRDVEFVEEPNPSRKYREEHPVEGEDPNDIPAMRTCVNFQNVPGPKMKSDGEVDRSDWVLDIHPEYGPHCHAVNPYKSFMNEEGTQEKALRRLFCPEDPFSFMLLKRNGYIDGVASGMFGSQRPEIFFEREKLPPDTDDPLEGITDDCFEGELYFYITSSHGFGGSRVFTGRNVKFPEYAEYAFSNEIWKAKKFKTYQEAENFGREHNISTAKKRGVELNESWFNGFSVYFTTKAFTAAWKIVSEKKEAERELRRKEEWKRLDALENESVV